MSVAPIPGPSRPISIKEVSQHATSESFWIVIDGKVLDITEFARFDHPGGEGVLIPYAGRDATDAFREQNHSTWAVAMCAQYQIGVLAGSSDAKAVSGGDESGTVPQAGEGDAACCSLM